ncbi:hypothetical protein [Streptomyces sp. NPDC003863]
MDPRAGPRIAHPVPRSTPAGPVALVLVPERVHRKVLVTMPVAEGA